jgi:hypothetical protein
MTCTSMSLWQWELILYISLLAIVCDWTGLALFEFSMWIVDLRNYQLMLISESVFVSLIYVCSMENLVANKDETLNSSNLCENQAFNWSPCIFLSLHACTSV